MHTWYRAVCDEHKEMCCVLVTSTFHIVTTEYLEQQKYIGSNGNKIVQWLDNHYGCNLRLVRRDDELDKLWNEYKEIDKDVIKS